MKTDAEAYQVDDEGKRVMLFGFPIKIVDMMLPGGVGGYTLTGDWVSQKLLDEIWQEVLDWYAAHTVSSDEPTIVEARK